MGTSVIGLYQFLSGASMLGAWTAGVYFVRFWNKTHDRLFCMFGIAFWLMALERVVLIFVSGPHQENHSYVYLIRLVAFLIILAAIADKNRKKS